jgi:hypothetical protein
MSVMDRVRGIDLAERVKLPPWQLVAAGFLASIYIGWAIYTSADRGVDRGVGVLVSWPALILLTALVLAPFAAIGVFVTRLIRQRSRAALEPGVDPGVETITTATFPC